MVAFETRARMLRLSREESPELAGSGGEQPDGQGWRQQALDRDGMGGDGGPPFWPQRAREIAGMAPEGGDAADRSARGAILCHQEVVTRVAPVV